MAKICYIEKNFSVAHTAIIIQANQILNDYAGQGYDLTLRQLYYQFIARDLFPQNWANREGTKNTEQSYKKLGSIINDARLAGRVDWNHITDRTRNMVKNGHWDSPEGIVRTCANQFQIDKWANQKNYVEVWVEKDALVGVLEVACRPLDVPFFSCRGYTSQSEMWAGAMRLVERARAGKELHIIHLGDHDPSGIDMSRDITDRLQMFVQHHCGEDVTVNRVALNMDQVREYNPPPNPAKVTDSRAEKYMDKYGDESWELDALEPAVLTELITNTVNDLMDGEQWEEDKAQEQKHRDDLAKAADRWDEVAEFLEQQ